MAVWLLKAGLSCTIIITLAGCAAASPTPASEPIELRIATTPYLSQLAHDLTQQFATQHPYVTFTLSLMPPEDAVDDVENQAADGALVAQSIDPSHVELEATQIGQQAVVLAVHPSNPIDQLGWDQVRDIFSGEAWDWAAVDSRWQSRQIQVVSQHAKAVSRRAFERQVMDGASVTPRALVATGDAGARKLIAEEPAAIGYLLTSLADDTVKVLTVNGTAPTPSAVASGTWPITRPINLVAHIDANVYVLDLIDFARARYAREFPAFDD